MAPAYHSSLRPRISSSVRMSADPADWSRYNVGDSVGVFLGNCWRKALIVELFQDSIVVEGKHLGSTQASHFSVHDARNVVHARELITVHFQEENFFASLES